MPKRRPSRRANGEGSIYQLPDGRWKAVLTVGWTAEGKRITKTKTAKRQADVRAWKEQQTSIRGVAEQQDSTTNSAVMLCDWVSSYLSDVERDAAPATHDSYRYTLESFIVPHLGRVTLEDLTPLAIRNLISDLSAEYAGTRTLQNVYAVLHACLGAAVELELIATNPCSKVTRPKYKRGDIRPFERHEISQILTATEDDRLHALYVVAFHLGLRQGELFGLQWTDYDDKNRTIRIQRQATQTRAGTQVRELKTNHSRRVLDVSDVVAEALHNRRRQSIVEKLAKNELIFPGKRGAVIRRNVFGHREWKPLLRRLNLEERGAHHMRHTFASHALTAGVPVHIVSRMLGHSSIQVTVDTYGHLIGRSGMDAAEKVSMAITPGYSSTTSPDSPESSADAS